MNFTLRVFLLKLCVAVPLLLVATHSVFSQTGAPDLGKLEEAITAELAAAKTPGAAFAVVSGDKVVFAKGFGVTSAEGGQAVTPDTLFRMGSTTKMFTAAAVAALAESGKLQLDQPVGKYIKNLPPKIAKLTPHQLLSQSSGLRDFGPLASGNDDAALRQNVSLWKDDVFFTEPDTIYSYSSANYWLAGLLLEEVTGKAYSDALAEIILKPLGMNRSAVRPFDAMTFPLALGHDVKTGSATVIRPIDNNAAKYPGGSLYSSVNELSRFAIAMLNGGMLEGKQVLPAAVVEKLTKPQFYLPGEEKAYYGYGLLGFTDSGVKTVSHGGVSRGYGSTIFFAPEQKLAIIVLANSNGQTLPRSRRAATEMFLTLKNDPVEPQKTSLAAADLQRYVGKYSHAPQVWEVFVRDGKLFIKQDGKDFELRRNGRDSFEFDQGGVVFVPNKQGQFDHIFMGLYAARRI